MSFLQPSRVIVGVGDFKDGVRPLAWALAEARRRGAQLHAVRAWREPSQLGSMSRDWRHLLEEGAERGSPYILRIPFPPRTLASARHPGPDACWR